MPRPSRERDDARDVHDRRGRIHVETRPREQPFELARPARRADVVRDEPDAMEPAERKRVSHGDQWIRGVVEGHDERAARCEHAFELAQRRFDLGNGVEVVERGCRHHPVERAVHVGELAHVATHDVEGRMAPRRFVDHGPRHVDRVDALEALAQQPGEAVAYGLFEEIGLQHAVGALRQPAFEQQPVDLVAIRTQEAVTPRARQLRERALPPADRGSMVPRAR